jgi:hypothetical protein
MTFGYGSGSADSDQYTTPGPDPAIFVSDLGKMGSFLAYFFLKLYIRHFSKIKSHKEVTKQWESRVFLLFSHDVRRMNPDPYPYLVLMDPGPNLGGPKTY